MIVKTRYRDISDEELLRLHPPSVFAGDTLNWEKMRGQPVEFFVPALPDTDSCGGPFFRIHNSQFEGTCWICPHLAEIGD